MINENDKRDVIGLVIDEGRIMAPCRTMKPKENSTREKVSNYNAIWVWLNYYCNTLKTTTKLITKGIAIIWNYSEKKSRKWYTNTTNVKNLKQNLQDRKIKLNHWKRNVKSRRKRREKK